MEVRRRCTSYSRRFYCCECVASGYPDALKLQSVRDLEAHISSAHIRCAQFQCPFDNCQQVEETLPDISRHMRQVHPTASSAVLYVAQTASHELFDRLLLASVALTVGKSTTHWPTGTTTSNALARPYLMIARSANSDHEYRQKPADGRPSVVAVARRQHMAAPAGRPSVEIGQRSAENRGFREAEIGSAKSTRVDAFARRTCRVCKSTRPIKRKDLARHIYCMHIGRWPFKCGVCPITFDFGEEPLMVRHGAQHGAVLLHNDIRDEFNFYMYCCFSDSILLLNESGSTDHGAAVVGAVRPGMDSARTTAGAGSVPCSGAGSGSSTGSGTTGSDSGRRLQPSITGTGQIVNLRERSQRRWADSPWERIPLMYLAASREFGNFACSFCPNSQKLWKCRDVHIYEVHLRILPYICLQCPDKSFIHRAVALAHAKSNNTGEKKHVILDRSESLKTRLQRLRSFCFDWNPPSL